MEKKEHSHPGNRIHPSYIPNMKQRELSLAYQLGANVFRFDGDRKSGGATKWVWPTPNEYMTAQDASYVRGAPVFEDRLRRWTTDNVFADSIKVSAAQPINSNIIYEGWPKDIEQRISGQLGGLDGQGQGLVQILENVLENVFFAGIHFIRLTYDNEARRSFWVPEPARNLLYWEYEYTDFGVVLTEAVLAGVGEGGQLLRRVFKLNKNSRGVPESVSWEVYRAYQTDSVQRRIYAPESIDSLILPLEETPWRSGTFPRVQAIPIEPFACTWDEPYQSPAPFADAAELQLKADRGHSHLEEYHQRVATSAVFVVAADLEEDEVTGLPKIPKAGARRLMALPPGGKGTWEELNGSFSPANQEYLASLSNTIRKKTMDSMDQPWRGDVKATQVALNDARSMSWLELCYLGLAPPSKRLLLLMAQMERAIVGKGSSEPTLLFSKKRPKTDSDAGIQLMVTLKKEGIISHRETVLEALPNVDDSIDADVWAMIIEKEAAMDALLGSGAEEDTANEKEPEETPDSEDSE